MPNSTQDVNSLEKHISIISTLYLILRTVAQASKREVSEGSLGEHPCTAEDQRYRAAPVTAGGRT